MRLSFFGHAAVGIKAKRSPNPGLKVLFDPYEAGGFGGLIDYPPIDFDPDQILVTHTHADHNFTTPFPAAKIISPCEDPDAFDTPEAKTLNLTGLEVDHDAWGGKLRGGTSWVLRIIVDGLSVVHLGDIGEIPSPRRLSEINKGEPVDILLMTCGGFFTVGATEAAELSTRLGARLIIPIHTATEKCRLPHLEGLEAITRHYSRVERHEGPLDVDASSLTQTGKVILLSL